jgi:GTP cyclohydrolase II
MLFIHNAVIAVKQLEKSISLIQSHGHGYIIYLRDHEGRGVGLTERSRRINYKMRVWTPSMPICT